MKLKLIITLLAFTASSADLPPNWKADAAKAQIKFTIGGPFGEVEGSLKGLKADIVFDANNLSASSVTASVDAGTIETGIGLRDRDLCNEEEWLDTKKYPLITFRSTGIRKSGNGYIAAGNLTLKGVSRAVNIPFTFTNTGSGGVFKGKFSIHREDYGVGQTKNVGSEITISLEVPVSR